MKTNKLKSGLDYLNFYLGIDRERVREYVRAGKFLQLDRIAFKLLLREERAKKKGFK